MNRLKSEMLLANPVRLVWLITALGCVAGIVMISIVWWSFADIRGERQRLEQFEAGLTGARALIDQTLLEEKWYMYRLLSKEELDRDPGGAPEQNLTGLIADYRKHVDHPAIGGPFGKLEQQVVSLEETGKRCLAWTERWAKMVGQLSASRDQVDKALQLLNELMLKTQGNQRLRQAVLIRQYRRAGEGKAELARHIIRDVASVSDPSTIRQDLADLAVLCERLQREDQPDFLADLKDNRIRTILVRLRRYIGLLAELQEGQQLLDEFENALFGSGYLIENEHQTVIPGVGGLYQSAVGRLGLAEERETLRLEITTIFDNLNLILQDLSGQVEVFAGNKILRMEQSLHTAWRTMFLLWLITGVVFVLISTRIIQTVKRQIRTIEEANAALRESREELQESERELRRLSSNLLTVQESERRRISLELHDELGQAMAALKLQVRGAEKCLGKETPPSLRAECENLRQAINEIIENVRRLSRDLSPVALDDLGFEAAVEYLLNNFARLNQIRTERHVEEVSHLLSREAQRNIYRILQELLNNIGKHAQAEKAWIEITRKDGQLSFLVKDDGRGFDVEKVRKSKGPDKGFGLTAIAERVRLLGGKLDVQSAPGEGTTVIFTASI
jgi:signal transduction histidine kinase